MFLTANTRYSAIDAFRGVIMMVMAIDHASALIARQHGSEFWAGAMSSYSSAFPFLTRLITHICAPGFFFLMGAGIYWLAAARRETGTSLAVVVRSTVWRGAVILGLGQIVEMPLLTLQSFLKPASVSLSRITAPPPNDGSELYWGFIVLSGLGAVMVACGFLLRLRPYAWLLVSVACVVATNSLLPASGKPGPWWNVALLAPGISQHILVIYPLIPWLAAASAGMYFGHWWRQRPQQAPGQVWILGIALLLFSVILRFAGGWGNIRPPRDSGWIEFLNNVKYPPSLVFLTMSLGAGLLLLACLVRLPQAVKSERSPLIVFGQTPLFFYVAHLWLLTLFAFAFFREAASLEGAYGIWAIVLVLLYPLCERYRNFKLSKPRESLWRFF